MTETELEYQFCFNCNDRKNCYTKPKDCTRIQEEIGLQEMTNEEYLKSLDTKQLAKFLADKFNEVVIAEWLKQPHTVKE